MTTQPASISMSFFANSRNRLALILVAILIFGIWLRLPDGSSRQWKGADEGFYERYVTQLQNSGLFGWPQLVQRYVADQRESQQVFLPPTRVLFLSTAFALQRLTGTPALEAVRWVSFAAAVATLALAAAWLWKRMGPVECLGVTAMLTCSPLLIHLAHRALIDGFFAFWVLAGLLGLFESLRKPSRASLTLYGLSLVALVLTKENAAFVIAAYGAIVITNRWTKLGEVRRSLWFTTVFAPVVGLAILFLMAGGPYALLEAYRLNVQKSIVSPYAIQTGDGPWHRYLLDFLLVNLAVTLPAIAAIGSTWRADATKRYFVIFVAVTYALMAQVRYGMNMRYGMMWEFPLCLLALSLFRDFAGKSAERWHSPLLAAMVMSACAIELQSYRTLFASGSTYDPVAGSLTQPLRMFKPAGLQPNSL